MATQQVDMKSPPSITLSPKAMMAAKTVSTLWFLWEGRGIDPRTSMENMGGPDNKKVFK